MATYDVPFIGTDFVALPPPGADAWLQPVNGATWISIKAW